MSANTTEKYVIQTGEHFALSTLDAEDQAYYAGRLDGNILWRNEEGNIDGLVEAEAKAILHSKTYRHVRIVRHTQEIVKVVE